MAEGIQRDLLTITGNEDIQLAEKLIRRGLPDYRIREASMDRGYSATYANRLIIRVREKFGAEGPNTRQVETLVVGIVLLLLALVIAVSFILSALSGAP